MCLLTTYVRVCLNISTSIKTKEADLIKGGDIFKYNKIQDKC